MAKNDNLTDFLTDVADAIREKKGTTELINPQDFASEIASIESGGGNGWTGHADAEGLRAIGWTDDDIAYYQENGVDWNEEDDHLHLVSDDNKALYGVLTASNISTYKDRIVYLPKIDTSALISMQNLFDGCGEMVALPMLDTSNVTNMSRVFYNCYQLRCIPPLNWSSVKQSASAYAFSGCTSLRTLDVSTLPLGGNIYGMFYQCASLREINLADSSQVTNAGSLFYMCGALQKINLLDLSSVTNAASMFAYCFNLDVRINNLKTSLDMKYLYGLTKDKLIYTINNEAATSAITITLASYIYDKYSTDPDIVEALANHPNITLAK